MSHDSLTVLFGAAASIAFFHTLVGVDHYLPFIVVGRARGWSLRKVAGITAACGVGHVVGSIVLGAVGISLGVALDALTWVESVRGSLAAWGLIAFGLVYAGWAWIRRHRRQSHAHVHAHANGTLHTHDHDHIDDAHVHAHGDARRPLSFWALFVIFVLGPCEPLIPLLMAPAWEHHWLAVAGVAGVFSTVTIATMMSMVGIGLVGLRVGRLARLERHVDVWAGLAIAASGLAIQVLGI